MGESLPNPTSGSRAFDWERLKAERAAVWQAELTAMQKQYWRQACVPERHAGFNGGPASDGWGFKLGELKSRLGSGMLVVLIGARGTGKTQMAVELIRKTTHDAREPQSARYAKAMDLFLDVRATFNTDADERDVVARYVGYGLLVLDELQVRGDTPFEDRMLTHVIDRRYDAELDTVLITNQSRNGLRESLGESIYSRIIETGGVVDCDWDSFRKVTQ